MNQSKFWTIFKRYGRAFVAGGLSAMVVLIPANISGVEGLDKLGISLGIAFLSGGILALEKALRWTEPERPMPLPGEDQTV